MSTSQFGGLWTYPSTLFSQHEDFMFIDEVRGRIITFVVISIEPVKYIPMCSWYRPESATSITSRLRPIGSWVVHEFQLDGDLLSWTYGGANHAWRRVPANKQPEWLEASIATANSKMDATEQDA